MAGQALAARELASSFARRCKLKRWGRLWGRPANAAAGDVSVMRWVNRGCHGCFEAAAGPKLVALMICRGRRARRGRNGSYSASGLE